MPEANPVRPLPALLAPLAAVRREFADIARNPVACLGGVAGSGAFMAAAVALALFGPSTSDAHEPEPDELVMEFLPGELVRLGQKLDPEKIPEKIIVQNTVAAPPPVEVKVTTDQTIADKPPEPTEPVKDPKPRPDKPPVKPKPDAKPGETTHDANTPYNDPATADQLPGDPFGSADGWSDRAKDGDPWATAVLAALNGMTVGSYAGLGQDVSFKFQLVICADGSIDEVRTKKSTGKPDFDGQIRNALGALKLPKAPADIAKQLAGKCKKIPYEFTWSGKSANGKVR
jgi:outer membrane biosynthesis protein TonB